MKSYRTFDAWAETQPPRHQLAIGQLRSLVADVAPNLVETSKWGNACWLKKDLPLLFLHAEDDHLQFGFFAGALLNDPDALLRGKGKYVRHIRVETAADIQTDAFSSMIRRAVRAPAYR